MLKFFNSNYSVNVFSYDHYQNENRRIEEKIYRMIYVVSIESRNT